VREGEFREDLYYRLNVVTRDAAAAARPPRRHPDAGGAAARSRLARRAGSGRKRVSRRLDAWCKYRYPGNVRELENIVHRAVVLARGELLTTADLPPAVTGTRATADPGGGTFVERVAAFEQQLILDALQRSDGVQTRAARLLGISERHLRYKLHKYGLETARGTGGEPLPAAPEGS
jgi:DNA-binding NtrC family response regulator